LIRKWPKNSENKNDQRYAYKFAFGRYAAGCLSALMGLVTVTFDLLTVKLIWESCLGRGTFVLNFGTLGFWVIELFAMYATDGRTHKSNAYCPLPYGLGHNNRQMYNCVLSKKASK